MPQLQTQQRVARQVERIVRQLTSLSTLPTVAAGLLTQINDRHADPALLAENIQSDPALTARVLMLANQHGIRFTDGPTITEAVAKLPLTLLREAVISVKVFGVTESRSDDSPGTAFRRQMALHSLAVGCYAERIAEQVLPPTQRQTAYLAGLLHDIGKCALDEVMPKSFAKMIQQARSTQASLAHIEQTHLGLDHAILGKRLAQKWRLPEAIGSAIWLHHCDAQALTADLPDIHIARVVALADRLARRSEMGQSGSYDTPDDIEELADLLSISPEQLDAVSETVLPAILEKCRQLGLEGPNETTRYYHMIHQTAAGLAQDNSKLAVSSQAASMLDGQVRLVEEFLNQVDENATALDAAQELAGVWQKRCHSGMTCVYVCPDSTEPYIELAALDRQGRSELKTLQLPSSIPPVPEIFRRHAAIVPVADAAKWLVEQLQAEFDPRRLKMAPLRMGDEVVGVLIFEAMAPIETLVSEDIAPLSCRVAASVIAMAQAGRKHEQLAERFVQVMSNLRQARAELARQQSLAGLAEMAAGAAHELNNPLAVISGRAQLLQSVETDEDKKQMLNQIQQRTAEISKIVSDLLNFARPAAPDKRAVSVAELLSSAIEKTKSLTGTDAVEIEIAGDEKDAAVYVDPHQVSQSVAFILANALQSYKGENGPVWIECSPSPVANAVWLAIRDRGCGMDAKVLANACQPFYSGSPAGRRRGMGLARAQRMLLLNGGDLKLASEADTGTTVTVTLPKV